MITKAEMKIIGSLLPLRGIFKLKMSFSIPASFLALDDFLNNRGGKSVF